MTGPSLDPEPEDDHLASYKPLLLFDTDDVRFVHGFECGAVWARLRATPDEPVTQTMHACNVEMVLRMGEATRRPVESRELGDDWIDVTFGPSEEENA